MEATAQNPIEKIISTMYRLFYRMVFEAPLTFIILLLLLAGFYILKHVMVERYIKSKPRTNLPSFIQDYFYSTSSNWPIYRFIFGLVQFCFVTLFTLYILSLLGLKVPEGTF